MTRETTDDSRPTGGVSVKVKDALLKRRFTDRQAGVAYERRTGAG
jgi:hypothetical protein